MNFLHDFIPQPILLQAGDVTIRYYGLLIAIAIATCFFVALRLAKRQGITSDDMLELVLWLIVGGIIGARLYDVLFVDWPYFQGHLADIFKIWQGGLAIHGAIIGGLAAAVIFSKLRRINFWNLAAVIFTVLPLGQAVGRWGNYFNQELFGGPTGLPWGIPISPANRPEQFASQTHFHPAFLYESLLNLVLFIAMLLLFKKSKLRAIQLPFVYLIGYSVIRFSTEFIRIDPTPVYLGLRLPQLVSLVVAAVSVIVLASLAHQKPGKKAT